jgi:hypothetical protein
MGYAKSDMISSTYHWRYRALLLAVSLAAGGCSKTASPEPATPARGSNGQAQTKKGTMVSRDREELRQQVTAALDEHLTGKVEGGCPAWSDEDRSKLLKDLYDSLTADLHPAVPNPDVSNLGPTLGEFCSLGAKEGDLALRQTWKFWHEQSGEKVTLLISLAAVAPTMKKMRKRLAVGDEQRAGATAKVTLKGFGELALLLAKVAQPSKFERLLPLTVGLFARANNLSGSPPAVDGAAFVAWFMEHTRTEPTGLLEFDEREFNYLSDPVAWLNLGNSMQLSADKARTLAELIHAAENNFVLCGGPPNATSLADLANAMAEKAGKPHLDGGDLDALVALLNRHKYQGQEGRHGYNTTEALAELKGEADQEAE